MEQLMCALSNCCTCISVVQIVLQTLAHICSIQMQEHVHVFQQYRAGVVAV